MENIQPDILMYALSTCVHCKRAKEYFTEHNISFACINVDTFRGEERAEVLRELKKHNPKISFPTFIVGAEQKVILGFVEAEIQEALGL